MGGGNAQKSATKRERNNLKKAKEAKRAAGGSGRDRQAKMMASGFQCKICLTQFMGTTKEPALRQHVEARHAGEDFSRAFPTFGGAGASAAPAPAQAARQFKPDPPKKEKKKKYKRKG